MNHKTLFALYVLLSIVDFAATVFLINHGFADEANPLIRGFAALFSSFWLGLLVYKTALLCMVAVVLRSVHQRDTNASGRLLAFANVIMVLLACWHVAALHISLAG